MRSNFLFERSSGYAGYRCQNCSTWLYEGNLLICSCESFKPKPCGFYVVLYECRLTIIEISPKGDGFFAFGQEPQWDLSAVSDWIKEIDIKQIKKTYETLNRK